MLTKRIIPCLDVKDGIVVKGVQFKDHREIGSIMELSKRYSQEGADELVFYDIQASTRGKLLDKGWVSKIAEFINIPFCVAGGIKSLKDAETILRMGADKISINTPAIQNPNLLKEISNEFGSQVLVIGIDCKTISNKSYVFAKTGDENTSYKTNLLTKEWVSRVQDLGAGEIVLNSMSKDGMRNGYDIKLIQEIKKISRVPVIASGGAGSKDHFKEVFQRTDVDAALAASVFHKEKINIIELKKYLSKKNISVRL